VYGAAMSYNRFAYLLSHIRLDDKTKRDEARIHDKFAPARYFRHFFVSQSTVFTIKKTENQSTMPGFTCIREKKLRIFST
jgi:hypothetical protein